MSTTNSSQAELRVSYQGDHTAVTTGVANECVSKWGAWGLYKHATTDVPASYLPNNTLTYYQKSYLLSINGPSYLCSTADYSISNLPSGATVEWSIDGFCAEESTSTPQTNSLFRVDRLDYGEFRVKAKVTIACAIYYLETPPVISGFPYSVFASDILNDGMGTSDGTLCSNAPGYDNYYNTFKYNVYSSSNTPFQAPMKLHYMLLDQNSNIYYQDSLTISAAIGHIILPNYIPVGYYNLEVRVKGGPCDEASEWYEGNIEVVECGSYRMAVFPNPVDKELTVKYQNDENLIKTEKTSWEEFSVKLFDQKGKVLKEGKSKMSEDNIVLQTGDLQNGTYFLHIFRGKNIERKQIIVSH